MYDKPYVCPSWDYCKHCEGFVMFYGIHSKLKGLGPNGPYYYKVITCSNTMLSAYNTCIFSFFTSIQI